MVLYQYLHYEHYEQHYLVNDARRISWQVVSLACEQRKGLLEQNLLDEECDAAEDDSYGYYEWSDHAHGDGDGPGEGECEDEEKEECCQEVGGYQNSLHSVVQEMGGQDQDVVENVYSLIPSSEMPIR